MPRLRWTVALVCAMCLIGGCGGTAVPGRAVDVPPLVTNSTVEHFRITWSAESDDRTPAHLTRHVYTVWRGELALAETEIFTPRSASDYHVFWLVSETGRSHVATAIGFDELSNGVVQEVPLYPSRNQHELKATTEVSSNPREPTSDPFLSVSLD